MNLEQSVTDIVACAVALVVSATEYVVSGVPLRKGWYREVRKTVVSLEHNSG